MTDATHLEVEIDILRHKLYNFNNDLRTAIERVYRLHDLDIMTNKQLLKAIFDELDKVRT